MGTRSLIGIVHKNAYKGSYNHFDGYPTGVGQDLQKELADYKDKPDDFWALVRERSAVMRWVDATSTLSAEDCRRFIGTHQEVSTGKDWYSYLRCHHGSLLKRLSAGVATDDSTFIQDSLFCEWGYIFDADNEQVLILTGANHEPEKQWKHATTTEQLAADSAYYGCSVHWSGTLASFLALDMKHVKSDEFSPSSAPDPTPDQVPTERGTARIQLVRNLIEHYQESDEPGSFIRDLLTDIRHFCDANNVDFYSQINASYEVYLDERLDSCIEFTPAEA